MNESTIHKPMPRERASVTHRFKVGGLKGYITVGLYEDGNVGEIFLTTEKQGTFERGLLHCLALMISVALQHGVPLEKVVEKLKGVNFEPSGFTKNPKIPMAASIVDYLARWLEDHFILNAVRGCDTPPPQSDSQPM